MIAPNPHAKIDEENRERDRRAADAIRRHPELLQVAGDNLDRWISAEGSPPDASLTEWRAIFDFLSVEEIAKFLESRGPKAERLRQSSPFASLAGNHVTISRTA